MLPHFDMCFSQQQEICIKSLKVLQQTTRGLQSICSHAKIYSLDKVANIPILKKIMENILFKVKSLLQNNGHISLYWIGKLKLISIVTISFL